MLNSFIIFVIYIPILVGPVDCEWSEWQVYGQCSATCGEASFSKSRYKSVIEKNGGTCIGDETTIDNCTALPECPGTRLKQQW